jgi:hypothetical protein
MSPSKPEKTPYTGFNGCAGHPFQNRFFWVRDSTMTINQESTDLENYCEVLLDDDIQGDLLSSARFACLLIGKHWDGWTGGCKIWWLVLKQANYGNSWQRVGIGFFQEYSKVLGLFGAAEQKMITLI